MQESPHKSSPPAAFEDEADQPQVGLVREFWEFLLHNKKWWLIPIILSLLFIAALTILTASPVAPFIYTLF